MIKSERQRDADDSADDSLVRHVARNAALARTFAFRSTCSDSAEAANYREMHPLPLSLSLSLSLSCWHPFSFSREDATTLARREKSLERKASADVHER